MTDFFYWQDPAADFTISFATIHTGYALMRPIACVMVISILAAEAIPHLYLASPVFPGHPLMMHMPNVDIAIFGLTPILAEIVAHYLSKTLGLRLVAVVNHNKGIAHPIRDEYRRVVEYMDPISMRVDLAEQLRHPHIISAAVVSLIYDDVYKRKLSQRPVNDEPHRSCVGSDHFREPAISVEPVPAGFGDGAQVFVMGAIAQVIDDAALASRALIKEHAKGSAQFLLGYLQVEIGPSFGLGREHPQVGVADLKPRDYICIEFIGASRDCDRRGTFEVGGNRLANKISERYLVRLNPDELSIWFPIPVVYSGGEFDALGIRDFNRNQRWLWFLDCRRNRPVAAHGAANDYPPDSAAYFLFAAVLVPEREWNLNPEPVCVSQPVSQRGSMNPKRCSRVGVVAVEAD